MTTANTHSEAGPLSGIRIIEISETSAGAYCGRLLTGLGASVTLIEPPEGSPLRRRGPFRDDIPDREGSATHLHLQRGKRSLRLNLNTRTGQRIADRVLSEANVIILDVEREGWPELAFDPEALRTHHPHLHICTITPYGWQGPKAGWRGSELTAYAAGGYLRITGNPEREPVKAWGEQGHLQAGLHAALGIVAALHAEAPGGANGQHIDVAVVEAVSFLLGGSYQHAWFNDHEPIRNGPRLVGFGPGHLYPSTIRPCLDGWVHAHCNNRYPEMLAVLFEEPRLAEPDLLATLMGHADEVDDLMAPMLEATPRRDIVHRAQELRIPFTEVLAPSEVMADADGHHRSRDFWQTTGHPHDGHYHAPGPPVRFGRTPWHDGGAPRLGRDSDGLGTPAERVRWRRAGVA